MVNRERFNQELKDAQKLLAELLTQRAKLDKEIAQLRQDIGSLAQLAGRSPIEQGLSWQRMTMGLTDSCREVLRAVNEPLTVAEVRDGLERIGFDTASYTNILASIQTTLKRMDDVEESEKDGKKAYKLKPRMMGLLGDLTPDSLPSFLGGGTGKRASVSSAKKEKK